MRKIVVITIVLCSILGVIVCCTSTEGHNTNQLKDNSEEMNEIATFGAGCFWCVEAVFQNLSGVDTVISGYMGGDVKNPTYRQICTGTTGHAEVIQVHYNPQIISFDELLEIFWQTHDPTTLNRQGADVGTQYRSVIFYHNQVQADKAMLYRDALNKAGAFDQPIITEISEASVFYPAEDYHQNYYNLNKQQGYCRYVIAPKVKKMQEVFGHKLKTK